MGLFQLEALFSLAWKPRVSVSWNFRPIQWIIFGKLPHAMNCPYHWQLHPGSVFPFATKVALPCAAVAWHNVVNMGIGLQIWSSIYFRMMIWFFIYSTCTTYIRCLRRRRPRRPSCWSWRKWRSGQCCANCWTKLPWIPRCTTPFRPFWGHLTALTKMVTEVVAGR